MVFFWFFCIEDGVSFFTWLGGYDVLEELGIEFFLVFNLGDVVFLRFIKLLLVFVLFWRVKLFFLGYDFFNSRY